MENTTSTKQYSVCPPQKPSITVSSRWMLAVERDKASRLLTACSSEPNGTPQSRDYVAVRSLILLWDKDGRPPLGQDHA